jgi:hypothetical protein
MATPDNSPRPIVPSVLAREPRSTPPIADAPEPHPRSDLASEPHRLSGTTPEPHQVSDRAQVPTVESGFPQVPTVDRVPRPAATPPRPPTAVGDAARSPAHHAAPDAEPTAESAVGPDTNRSSIENWMAELRSSRRPIGKPDGGRHHGGDGRTVSVNELLRRRNRE